MCKGTTVHAKTSPVLKATSRLTQAAHEIGAAPRAIDTRPSAVSTTRRVPGVARKGAGHARPCAHALDAAVVAQRLREDGEERGSAQRNEANGAELDRVVAGRQVDDTGQRQRGRDARPADDDVDADRGVDHARGERRRGQRRGRASERAGQRRGLGCAVNGDGVVVQRVGDAERDPGDAAADAQCHVHVQPLQRGHTVLPQRLRECKQAHVV